MPSLLLHHACLASPRATDYQLGSSAAAGRDTSASSCTPYSVRRHPNAVLLSPCCPTPPQVVSAAAADDRGAAEAAAHATRLDKFEQRFAWFRGRLAEKREVWGVFPEHWRVPQVRGWGIEAAESCVGRESPGLHAGQWLCVSALLPGGCWLLRAHQALNQPAHTRVFSV